MNFTQYQDILAKNLVASARRLKLVDLNPKHTFKSTKTMLFGLNKSTFYNGHLSPDLNPFENLWFEMKRAVHNLSVWRNGLLKAQ